MDDTARMLVDTAERLFETQTDKAALIAAETGVWPANLWTAIDDAGLSLALVPEAAGGAGLSIPDALTMLRVSARHAAPIPLAETLLASWLLSGAGLPVPAGAMTVAPVALNDALSITKRGNAYRAVGRARRVPFARHVGHVALLGSDDGGQSFVAVVARERAALVEGENIAREPRDALHFDLDLPAEAVAPLPPTMAIGDLRAFGAAMRTVQIAGALSRTLDLTIRYAGERAQFGRPIGKFQAIQHQVAMLAAHSAAASAAADMAADAAGDGMEPLLIGAAKARAGEAASAGAAIAHAVHGAIGFTHEHSLHFSTKRLWSWRDEFGKESDWALLLGRAALAAGPQRLWADLITA